MIGLLSLGINEYGFLNFRDLVSPSKSHVHRLLARSKFMQASFANARCNLLAQHRTEHDRRRADRIKAVLLRDDGWSHEQIAAALFLRVLT
jgi:hypothetical protein